MKKIFLTAAMLVGLSLNTYAINLDIDKGGKMMNKVFKELKLNKDQKKQVKEIKADFGKQIDAVKRSRIAPEAQKMKMQALMEQQKESISKILTPEQKEKMEKLSKDHHKGSHKANHKTVGRGGAGIWVLAGIDLDEKQQEQYKQITEKYAVEREKLDEKQMQAVKNILTTEQKVKFDENTEKISVNSLKGQKIDKETRGKIRELRDNYKKEKKAIEMSRIAPEMQKQKLAILKEKLDTDIQKLIKLATDK